MKLKSISISVAATALLMAAPAYAADWVYVTKSASNAVAYYDNETIIRHEKYVMVWELWDHSLDKNTKERENKSLNIYDCLVYVVRSFETGGVRI